MIYAVPGKPWITYRIGDTVHTTEGISGKVIGHTRQEKYGAICAITVDADSVEHLVKKHLIRKVESNVRVPTNNT